MIQVGDLVRVSYKTTKWYLIKKIKYREDRIRDVFFMSLSFKEEVVLPLETLTTLLEEPDVCVWFLQKVKQ